MRRLIALALIVGCSPKYEAPSSGSSEAKALLARFPSLPAGVARIDREGDRFVPRLGDARLPVRADGAFSVGREVRVAVRLRDARPATGEVVDGWVVYRDGVAGGAIFQRPATEGTEDHVLMPSARTLRYDVALHGAGARFVNDTFEVLDAAGAPRLRMNPPTLIDAHGVKHRAQVSVDGCAVDRSAAAPWGRAFSPVDSCVISIAWDPMLSHPVLVDPAWTTTGSMATARLAHQAAVVGGKVLVAGGFQLTAGTMLSSAELFDPATGTWASAGAMAVPRQAHALVSVGGKALVVGNTPASSSAELYDPTSGWSVATAAPTSLTYPAATGVGGKVLVAGGGTSASELFDLSAGWSDAGTMAVVRATNAQAHTLSSGKVLIYGGGVSSAELWDSGTWTAAGSTTLAYGNSIVLSGDKVLAFSGRTPSDITTAAEIWSGGTTWTATGSLVDAVSLAPAAMLGNQVLVAGGVTASNGTSSAQRFDGAAWSKPSAMSVARYGNTATALPDGRVLVVGGANTAVLSSAEIFGTLAAGTACTASADCSSNTCLGGFCCTATCPAATCDANKAVTPACDATGACTTTTTDCAAYACASGACKTSCTSDGDCASTAYCNSSACLNKKANGATAAAANECTSGVVADGVCCDKACDGVCESCATGTCTAVMGAPKHGSCPAPTADPCTARSCDGTDGKTCAKFAGADVTCRTGSCDMGTETESATCDGSGACPAAITKACGAYACDGPACRRTCRSDFDCASGSTCDTITHECLAADTCDGDHTIHSHGGADKDCTPYKCAASKCLDGCTSSDACTSGFICDSTSKLCVAPTSGGGGGGDSGGGCAYGAKTTTTPLWLLALLAIGRKRAVRAHSRA